jgi:hypothetical protein
VSVVRIRLQAPFLSDALLFDRLADRWCLRGLRQTRDRALRRRRELDHPRPSEGRCKILAASSRRQAKTTAGLGFWNNDTSSSRSLNDLVRSWAGYGEWFSLDQSAGRAPLQDHSDASLHLSKRDLSRGRAPGMASESSRMELAVRGSRQMKLKSRYPTFSRLDCAPSFCVEKSGSRDRCFVNMLRCNIGIPFGGENRP